jgi:hypothetical protein
MSAYRKQQIIDALLVNKSFMDSLHARLLDMRWNPYSVHGFMGIVNSQMVQNRRAAAETMNQLGLSCTELEKTDAVFHATIQFTRAWKEFCQLFRDRAVDSSTLPPELTENNLVSDAVNSVNRVLIQASPYRFTVDKLLAILFAACRESIDNSWGDKERELYGIARRTFHAYPQEVWIVTYKRILDEVKRLLPSVRRQAVEWDFDLTEEWLLFYTVFFLFPAASYEDQGEGTVQPVISETIADDFRRTINERINRSDESSIGTVLFSFVSSLIDQVDQPNVDQAALLDVCYRFCYGVIVERFHKEQEITTAAAQVFQRYGLPTEDISSDAIACAVFERGLQHICEGTKELSAEKALEMVFLACCDQRKIRSDYLGTEWQDIVEGICFVVDPYPRFYVGVLSVYRKNLDEAFPKVHRSFKAALRAASQRAEDLQLSLPPDRLISLIIKSLR